MTIRSVSGPELTARQVYEIWRIRDVVFMFEQKADEREADGIDLDAPVTHWWIEDDAGLTSYLRTISVDGALKVGRVCTREDARGRGLSSALMAAVVDAHGDGLITLSAQAYLEDWYAGFGFERHGDVYSEAGIDHVWMERPGS